MSEEINMYILGCTKVLDAVLETFSKQVEDTQPKWNCLMSHGTWSTYLCSHSIWKDTSSLDL